MRVNCVPLPGRRDGSTSILLASVHPASPAEEDHAPQGCLPKQHDVARCETYPTLCPSKLLCSQRCDLDVLALSLCDALLIQSCFVLSC